MFKINITIAIILYIIKKNVHIDFFLYDIYSYMHIYRKSSN